MKRIIPIITLSLAVSGRHVPSQPAPNSSGYPCRALRTDKYLLIRNFHPERWPASTDEYQNYLNTAK